MTSQKPCFWMAGLPLAIVVLGALPGCGGNGSASDGTGSEVATTAISGSSDSSEGMVAISPGPQGRTSVLARLGRLSQALDPLPSAWAVPACGGWNSMTSACSAGAETTTYNGCSTTDPAIRITGSDSLLWSPTGCCTAAPLTASSSTPCSFARRTLTAGGAAASLKRAVGANEITLTTEDTSGYAQGKTGGFNVTCQGAGGNNTCGGQREISISGAHYTGQSGRAQWDHTVSTDAPIIEQGSGGTRKVLSATIRVQHNLAQYTSISTVTSTLTHTAGCCLPTGGSISTTFSGGPYDGKTETLSYGPGCGEATLNDTKQQQTGLTLHHCL